MRQALRAPARARVEARQGRASRQTLLKPSPVRSPALVSLHPVVDRLALVGPLPAAVVARDDGPVARGLVAGAAISGGQLVAHGPLQTDLPRPPRRGRRCRASCRWGRRARRRPPWPGRAWAMDGAGRRAGRRRPGRRGERGQWRMAVLQVGGPACMNDRAAPVYSSRRRDSISGGALHGALDLALAFAVLDGVALVVLGLALGQRDLALHLAVLPVQVERHQRVALLLDLADQAADLRPCAAAASWCAPSPG